MSKGWHVVLELQPHCSYEMSSSNGLSGLNYHNEANQDGEEISRKGGREIYSCTFFDNYIIRVPLSSTK